MNASNKLNKPAYFIPDPWTKTPSDSSYFSRIITQAIIQAVNDNSQSKLEVKTVINLIIAFFSLISPHRFSKMMAYAVKSIRKPWRKALFLDMFLLSLIHI